MGVAPVFLTTRHLPCLSVCDLQILPSVAPPNLPARECDTGSVQGCAPLRTVAHGCSHVRTGIRECAQACAHLCTIIIALTILRIRA